MQTPAVLRARAPKKVIRTTQVIHRLERLVMEEEANLESSQRAYGHYVDQVVIETPDDQSPVISSFTHGVGESATLKVTNFNAAEFDILWDHVCADVVYAWEYGKGRKHVTKPKDALFMLLCVLKHGSAWYKHAADFLLQPSSFERMMNKLLDLADPILSDRFIKTPDGMGAHRFQNYPCALYAHDVKFQQSNRPGGTFLDAKRYFSGKHSLYGFKVECSIGPNGRAVHVSNHYAGSITDGDIFNEHLPFHKKMLLKTADDMKEADFGEGSARFPGHWDVLVDKGYQGYGDRIRTIQPKKQPPNGSLSADDIERNRRVSSDRVLVENFFGRVNSLWNVMFKKYTWKKDRYDQMIRVCFALTNFHIGLQPLRAEDSSYYRRTLAKCASQAHEHRDRRFKAKQLSSARRNQRMTDSQDFSSSSHRGSSNGDDSPYGQNTFSVIAGNHRHLAPSPRAMRFEEDSEECWSILHRLQISD